MPHQHWILQVCPPPPRHPRHHPVCTLHDHKHSKAKEETTLTFTRATCHAVRPALPAWDCVHRLSTCSTVAHSLQQPFWAMLHSALALGWSHDMVQIHVQELLTVLPGQYSKRACIAITCMLHPSFAFHSVLVPTQPGLLEASLVDLILSYS